jgi:hypothetical protein
LLSAALTGLRLLLTWLVLTTALTTLLSGLLIALSALLTGLVLVLSHVCSSCVIEVLRMRSTRLQLLRS